jgi:hypothetical protein
VDAVKAVGADWAAKQTRKSVKIATLDLWGKMEEAIKKEGGGDQAKEYFT